MLVDGKKIAADIGAKVRDALLRENRSLSLSILSVGEDPVTRQFVSRKKKTATEVGVTVVEKRMASATTTEGVVDALAVLIDTTDGVVVQLPLPERVDRDAVLAAIPASHDVDCLGNEARTSFEKGDSPLLPPVVAAIKEILERYSVDVVHKHVVVIGKGILVGAPASVWFKNSGAHVESVDEHGGVAAHTTHADIIVLGAGAPGMLKLDMVKEGVVVLDAGASESFGKIVGDADPSVEQKTALLTPVPGGIGPIAVAKIFENLLVCNSIVT